MNFKQSFKRTVNLGILRKKHAEVPDGLMKRCKVCKTAVFVEEARQNQDICPSCGNYFRMHARHRIEQVLDEGSFEEWDTDPGEESSRSQIQGLLKNGMQVCPRRIRFITRDIKRKLKVFRKKQDWMRLCSQERDGSTESLQPSASVTAVFSWQAWEKWWEKRSPERWNGQRKTAFR